MLSSPKAGWAEISIGSWSDRCSYLNDVPFELLEAFIQLFETHRLQIVKFDAEGWEYLIIFDQYETHIIDENSEPVYHHIEIKIKDLTEKLLSDIRNDIDGWTDWLSYAEPSEKDLRERKEQLLSLCNTLEQHITNR